MTRLYVYWVIFKRNIYLGYYRSFSLCPRLPEIRFTQVDVDKASGLRKRMRQDSVCKYTHPRNVHPNIFIFIWIERGNNIAPIFWGPLATRWWIPSAKNSARSKKYKNYYNCLWGLSSYVENPVRFVTLKSYHTTSKTTHRPSIWSRHLENWPSSVTRSTGVCHIAMFIYFFNRKNKMPLKARQAVLDYFKDDFWIFCYLAKCFAWI